MACPATRDICECIASENGGNSEDTNLEGLLPWPTPHFLTSTTFRFKCGIPYGRSEQLAQDMPLQRIASYILPLEEVSLKQFVSKGLFLKEVYL